LKVCCFTGHRPKSLPWGRDEGDIRCAALKSKIRFTLENLIVENGYGKFISGMAMGADIICSEVVLSLKTLYPQIQLECAVPNYAFAESFRDDEQKKFESVLSRADIVTYVSPGAIYSKRDLMLRNIYMVDSADLVVAVYTQGQSGGTKNTLDYARRKNREIVIIQP